MYFSRSGSWLDLLQMLLLFAAIWSGGALLVSHVFGWRRQGWSLLGLGVGLPVWITLANLLGRFLPIETAFWIAATLLFAAGVGGFWYSGLRSGFLARLEGELPWLASFLMLFLLFTVIQRGLAIFDDYHNLPVVSVIAAGDMPPHFYFDPALELSYHYGLHIFAAALMRVGGLFAWSAFDISKALSLALTICLAWTWFSRWVRSKCFALFATVFLALACGVRWLLLLVPTSLLGALTAHVDMLGSGAASGSTLASSLTQAWNIEGGGPFPFPFAFMSGVFSPVIMQIGGSGAFHLATILTLLLVVRRRWSWQAASVYTLLLASLGLSSEIFFTIIWGGLCIAWVVDSFWSKAINRRGRSIAWLGILVGALLLALFQGGVLTAIAGEFLGRTLSTGGAAAYGYEGFRLAWPPAVISAHLGELRLNNLSMLILAVLEIGPVFFLGLYSFKPGWNRFTRRGDLLLGGLVFGAAVAGVGSLILRYGVERDTSRILWGTLFIWILLGLLAIGRSWSALQPRLRALIALGAGISILPGVVILSIQIIAIARPQQSYYVNAMDAAMSRMFWNELMPGSQVLDQLNFRSVALFGQAVHSNKSLREREPFWEELIEDPRPQAVNQAGIQYVYMTEKWWRSFSRELRLEYRQTCVIPLHEEQGALGSFRRLYDVSTCGP